MKKVLIIENNEEIRDIVAYILETAGYDVKGCSYSTESLSHTDAGLILLDEWINKKEGHMLCKEIKAVKELAHIPVIIFSTATDIADIAKNCNANGFVHKPFDLDTLLAEVQKFLPLNEVKQPI